MDMNLATVALSLATIAAQSSVEERSASVQKLFKALCARTSDRGSKPAQNEEPEEEDDEEDDEDEVEAGGTVEPRVYERIAEEVCDRSDDGIALLLPHCIELMNVDLFPGVMALLFYRCVSIPKSSFGLLLILALVSCSLNERPDRSLVLL
jgi:hypothetical protein